MIHKKEVPEQKVNMSEGFFDRSGVVECSVTVYNLTAATKADASSIPLEVWKDIFIFDGENKTLTVSNYSGVNLADFANVGLMF